MEGQHNKTARLIMQCDVRGGELRCVSFFAIRFSLSLTQPQMVDVRQTADG